MSYYYLTELDSFHCCEWELVGKFFQSKEEGMEWLSHMKKTLVEDYCRNPIYIAFRVKENEETQDRRSYRGDDFYYYKKKLNY